MKKEKQFSRRRRALRRVLLAAVLLFLVNHLLLTGLLFPIQAIRHNEERLGTGRTAVVCRDWAPEIHRSHLIYLTESENVTLLSGTYLTYLGWMDSFGVPVDCAEAAPIHGGSWNMGRGDKPSLFYVFGRVDDPEIEKVEVQVQYEDWENGEARRTAFAWESPREDWKKKDGRFYFLFQKYPMDWSVYPASIHPVAIGYDADGNEIARAELDQGASTYFG